MKFKHCATGVRHGGMYGLARCLVIKDWGSRDPPKLMVSGGSCGGAKLKSIEASSVHSRITSQHLIIQHKVFLGVFELLSQC